MDPKLTKGLTMLVAIALYVGAAYLGDVMLEAKARELAALLIGWQAMRRPGDLEPGPKGSEL